METEQKKMKVFIVDDHYMIIEGIHSLLSKEPGITWTGHAINAASCMEQLVILRPDIILMDINLPDKSGTELCKEVKQLYPSIHIIALSSFNQQGFIQKMLDNGASGYLLKNAEREEIIEAMHRAMEGGTYLSAEPARILKKESANQVIVTRREKEVLELIAEGFTNKEIAAKLFISITTVDTHRNNLLEKFKVSNVASLVKVAVTKGIL